MKPAVFAALAAVVLLPAAIAEAQASHDPSSVESGIYKIDTHHSIVQFAINHLGFNDFLGTFPHPSGTLKLDAKNLAASQLDVSIPVSDLATANPDLDGELKGEKWFDAGKYPTIRFVSSTVTREGTDKARIDGILTMHGVSRPMTLDATLGGAGRNPMSKAYTVGFSATGMVKRSDFGVTSFIPMVGDEVKLRISAAFERAQ